MGEFFDILVGSLGLLCENHMYIVVVRRLRGMARKPVSVKYRNQAASFHRLIVAKQVKEPSSGPVQILFRQLFQLLPGKYHVIAVNQKICVLFGRLLISPCLRLFCGSAFLFPPGSLPPLAAARPVSFPVGVSGAV